MTRALTCEFIRFVACALCAAVVIGAANIAIHVLHG